MKAIVAACDINNSIGNSKTNSLPWSYNGEDLAMFKETTLNKVVIMGRKTWESLGTPLIDRTNVVISGNGQKRLDIIAGAKRNKYNNVLVYPNLVSAYKDFQTKDICFIGGRRVFEESLERNMVDIVYLTKFNNLYEGDIYMPRIPAEFKVSSYTTATTFTRYILTKRC